MTSGVTLLSVFALYIFGGSVIQNFALAMLIGMVAGVYSTIFIASPVIIYWENFKARKTAALE
jgi:preprotein translocase subunit SecF